MGTFGRLHMLAFRRLGIYKGFWWLDKMFMVEIHCIKNIMFYIVRNSIHKTGPVAILAPYHVPKATHRTPCWPN